MTDVGCNRVGDFSLVWGEGLVWDDVRERLYFVDCAQQTLHWLEGAQGPLHSMKLSGVPAGVAPRTWLRRRRLLLEVAGDGPAHRHQTGDCIAAKLLVLARRASL